jgi:hypothetical protein
MEYRDNLCRFALHELNKARKGSSVLGQDKAGEDKRQYLRPCDTRRKSDYKYKLRLEKSLFYD